jgi:hypothetical protein
LVRKAKRLLDTGEGMVGEEIIKVEKRWLKERRWLRRKRDNSEEMRGVGL